MENEMRLPVMLAALRRELKQAVEDANKEDKDLYFNISGIDIELDIAFKESEEVGSGLNISILNGSVKKSDEVTYTQKLRLNLKLDEASRLGEDGKPKKISAQVTD